MCFNDEPCFCFHTAISVWCDVAAANFGDVKIPASFTGLASPGPALKCSQDTGGGVADITKTPAGFNCEPLSDKLQVRWLVEADEITIELVGIISETDYMGFGPSGVSNKTFMIGADPVIVDTFGGNYRARDFYMSDRSQCSGGKGVCPDTEKTGAVEDAMVINGERDSGITLVRYKKPLNASDIVIGAAAGSEIDQPISVVPGEKMFTVWSIGPVNPETGCLNFTPPFLGWMFPLNSVGLLSIIVRLLPKLVLSSQTCHWVHSKFQY